MEVRSGDLINRKDAKTIRKAKRKRDVEQRSEESAVRVLPVETGNSRGPLGKRSDR